MSCPKIRKFIHFNAHDLLGVELKAELDDMEAELQQEVELRCLAGKLRNTIEKRYFELEAENKKLNLILFHRENGLSHPDLAVEIAKSKYMEIDAENKRLREVLEKIQYFDASGDGESYVNVYHNIQRLVEEALEGAK